MIRLWATHQVTVCYSVVCQVLKLLLRNRSLKFWVLLLGMHLLCFWIFVFLLVIFGGFFEFCSWEIPLFWCFLIWFWGFWGFRLLLCFWGFFLGSGFGKFLSVDVFFFGFWGFGVFMFCFILFALFYGNGTRSLGFVCTFHIS